MSTNNLHPEKITKPIQLLGAWLAGLFSIDSCFLFAASNMDHLSWEPKALVIAAIINVPLFLLAVFLLQTKFRPELQEDSYYSSYLSQKTNEPIVINKHEAQIIEIHKKIELLKNSIEDKNTPSTNKEDQFSNIVIGINEHMHNRQDIKLKAAELGAKRITTFGADYAPKHKNVSISQYLDNFAVEGIVRTARDLGFTSYSFFDNSAEETEEDVLFGSYGEPKYEIVPKIA